MELNIFALDQAKADSGVWFTYPQSPDIGVKIRSLESSVYISELEKHRLNFSKGFRGALPEKISTLVAKKAVSSGLVADWDGLESGGKAVKYTANRCFDILNDERYIDFYAWILSKAKDIQNYGSDAVEEAEKN